MYYFIPGWLIPLYEKKYFQLTFVGTIGNGYEGDIALDDISYVREECGWNPPEAKLSGWTTLSTASTSTKHYTSCKSLMNSIQSFACCQFYMKHIPIHWGITYNETNVLGHFDDTFFPLYWLPLLQNFIKWKKMNNKFRFVNVS